MEVTVNERIKILMKELGMTPYAFAKKIGVSATLIYNIIGRDLNSPSHKVSEAICRVFNVNGDWLLTGRGEMFIPKD